MSGEPRNGTALTVAMMLAATAVAAVEFTGLVPGRGALLFTVVLWTAVAQGCVAVVAATEVTGARWTAALRPELLAASRLLPFLALLFLLLGLQLGIFPWSASPNRWLNGPFFLARNLALLAAAAAASRAFAARALRRDPSARRAAIAYLFAYVACQTLVAFDWVMSLSWPWVSSMLGLYFFVEALYAGLAAAGLLFFLRRRRARGAGGEAFAAAGRDAGLLLFGFSVLWGGLFFAQFLLIWYGNLPEEVGFITLRLDGAATRALIPAFIALCWAVPFFVLLSAWAKRSAAMVAGVAAAVLLGLAAERLFLILPVLPLRPAGLLVENASLLAVWLVAALSAEPVRSAQPPETG